MFSGGTSQLILSLKSAIRQTGAKQNESQKWNWLVNAFKVKKQKELSWFYCKNKRHIENACRKKTAEDNIRPHSLNIVRTMHQLGNEVEGSNLLVIYRLNHNPAPPTKVKN